jgi:hypothetical protein
MDLERELKQLASELLDARNGYSEKKVTAVIDDALDSADPHGERATDLLDRILQARQRIFDDARAGGEYPEPYIFLVIAAFNFVHASDEVRRSVQHATYIASSVNGERHRAELERAYSVFAELTRRLIGEFRDWTVDKATFNRRKTG